MRKSIVSQAFHDNGKQVTKELLDKLFEYRSGTLYRKNYGELTPITCTNKTGYIVANIFGTVHYVHRLVWCIHTGAYPEIPVDHIDHNKANNSVENLRLVSRREQACNMPVSKANKSGAVGVHFDIARQKYVAYIGDSNGKRKHLGRCSTLEEAVTLRKAAEKEYDYHENHGVGLKVR